VAVAPGWRRQGLALVLLEALLAEARRRGCLRATLEVDGGNEAAVRLYGRLGFRTEGIRRAYYRSGGDALIQWLEL
jgi:ribosomal-protein-alanine N-acetyltransferase